MNLLRLVEHELSRCPTCDLQPGFCHCCGGWPIVPVRCLRCTAERGAPVVLADCTCWDHLLPERAS